MAKPQRKDEDFIGLVIKLEAFGDQEIVIQGVEKDCFRCMTIPDMTELRLKKKTVRKAFDN